MLKDLIMRNRSCRRFYQEAKIERETLRELVDMARLSASAGNRQSLKYILSCEPEKNALIFSCLGWAGQLKDWPGPPEGERPSAHIIVLGDTEISTAFSCDHGIAAQSILLGSRDIGLGGCMHTSIQRDKLRKLLEIPARYEILLAISLGKPKESVVIETIDPGGPGGEDVKYWRDAHGVHHVPKRRL